MSITPGKIKKLDKRTLIYEAGDNVETICYIKKGTVTKETSAGSKTFSQGKFIGHFDLYDGFYSGDYYAEEGSEIFAIAANSPSDFVQYLTGNPSVHDIVAPQLCDFIKDLNKMYTTLYNITEDFYNVTITSLNRYIKCCTNLSETPSDFMAPHDASHYSFASQSFAKNYEIINNIPDAQKAAAIYKANGAKFLKIQISLINDIFTAYDDMVFYLRSMVSLFTSRSDKCLFAYASTLSKSDTSGEVHKLLEDMKTSITMYDDKIHKETGISLNIDYNRVDFFFMTTADSDDDGYLDNFDNIDDIVTPNNDDDIYADSFDDDDIYASAFDDDESSSGLEYSMDLSATLKRLCEFAEMSDRYDEFNDYIERFIALTDKESREDDVRRFRKVLTVAYYELYEEVFIHYAKSGSSHPLVELFLNYGFIDERLFTDDQLRILCNIPDLVPSAPCKIYRMKDWLMRIYNGQEIPSKNEFDMEYVDYVRDRKKNEALSADAERKLLTDNELKVRYEIQNMLKYNCRLLNGNLLSFFPMLHMDNFEHNMESMILTTETINNQISKLLEVDYSIFYREMLYENREKKIEKEAIQKEIFPNIILFPVAGVNGIMWQEISGKRSNSEGRIFLPALYSGKLEDTLLGIFGKYHWELCKTLQGTAWNNIAVPSLTSEYSDYVQFYRRNKELSSEKKELLKAQITRCRNNTREVFVYDYIVWMKFESTGAIRLNKVARRMLATYCPFAKPIREKVSGQPIFVEAMNKFERDRQKKVREIGLRFKALENKGAYLTKELTDTQQFYEEL